jgi:hypothetical protein
MYLIQYMRVTWYNIWGWDLAERSERCASMSKIATLSVVACLLFYKGNTLCCQHPELLGRRYINSQFLCVYVNTFSASVDILYLVLICLCRNCVIVALFFCLQGVVWLLCYFFCLCGHCAILVFQVLHSNRINDQHGLQVWSPQATAA